MVTKTLQNPYTVLGVSSDASADDIKSAYRRLALKYHPDRNPGDREAEERFKEISEAYATLRDPQARANFDRFGAQQAASPDATPDFSHVDWQTIFQEADIHIDWSKHPSSTPRTGNAMFDVLFGAVTGMMRNSGLLPGEHREVTLTLSLAEAREGSSRRVRVPGPSICAQCQGKGVDAQGEVCVVCSGRGVLRYGANVEVNVPKNVRSGQRLRLKGLGGPGHPPGDAYVVLQVHLPEGARLEGNDIYATLTLTPLEAERGTQVNFLGASFDIPAASQAEQRIRVAGAGLNGGDMVVTLQIAVWKGLWRKMRDVVMGDS